MCVEQIVGDKKDRERIGSLLQFFWVEKYGSLDQGFGSGGGDECVDWGYILENILLY